MRLLLDTSSFLWFVAGSDRLSRKARELMENFDNELILSMASLWEIAIKVSIGKLELLRQFDILIPEKLEENEIEILHTGLAHLSELIKLPSPRLRGKSNCAKHTLADNRIQHGGYSDKKE